MMDPAWVSIGIGLMGSIVGSGVTGAIAFAALKAWMARREERESTMGKRMDNAEADIEVQSIGLQRLDVRVSVLEDRSPHRQPRDFVPQ
jgi:hypothetical protein